MEKCKVLVIDDEEQSRRLLVDLLREEGCVTHAVASGTEALERVADIRPDLILLDVMMPDMDGFEVTRRLKEQHETKNIPIILITALGDRESRIRGLEAGAEEYLSKPIDRTDLRIRVRNLLRMKEYSDFLQAHNRILEETVQARTHALRDAFLEAIFTLMRAAEYRDDETGAHVKRISYYTRVLAEALGMDRDFCEMIFYASPMHDIGKIGTPDQILLKPGQFTSEEWGIMKEHTVTGGRILAGATSPYLKMGREIALGHHERWDGSGYPRGARGEAIPLPARIMQIADVYDALRSKRPYKPAYDHVRTMEIICEGDGRTAPSHFDPDILNAFKKQADMLNDIFEERSRTEA